MTALLGLLSGLLLLGVALALGGSAAAFVNGAGLLIVLLGTIAVTAISFTPEELAGLPAALRKTMFEPHPDATKAAHNALRMAERARAKGVLVLEDEMRATSGQPFLKSALALLVDGTDVAEMEKLLAGDAQALALRHAEVAEILRRAGEIAPAMGLIGTLIGLVQMLGRLNDPSSIGPAMAVALLTTFYGAVLAHMVCLPLAAKAERNVDAEGLVNQVYATAATAIGRQDSPRRLETLLNSLLPPEKRVKYFA